MTASPIDLISAALPLVVQGMEVNDPVVTLYGDEWSLTIMCPWTLQGPGVEIDWESGSIEAVVPTLMGRALEFVSAAEHITVDPTFHFSGSVELAVRADTDLDPWALAVPGIVVTGART